MKATRISTALSLIPSNPLVRKRVLQNFTKTAVPSKLLALLGLLSAFALPASLMAHAGDLDPTFGTGGIVTTANTGADAAALQSDGKIVVAGSISAGGGDLLRYNTNGTLDSSFGTGGEALIPTGTAAFAVAIQADGKILTANSAIRLTVFRFNTNGTLDNTFGTNGSVEIVAAGILPSSGGIAVQSNGKIVVVSTDIVARLLPNGQFDSTFGSNGVAPTVGGNSVTLISNSQTSNSQILIGLGSVTSLYAANGSLVAKFGVNGQTAGFPFDSEGGFVVTTDPVSNLTRIISTGSLTTSPSLTFGQTISGFLVMRYNSDGTLDNSFGTHAGVTTPFPGNIFSHAFAVAAQTNGEIVAAGQTAVTDVGTFGGPSDFGLVRYLSNGGIDTTFGNGGFVSTAFGTSEAFANAVLIQTDGKIIAVGSSDNGTTLARYLGN